MRTNIESPEQYINQLPEDRIEVMKKLRQTILDNLLEGFVETMSYGLISYVVPHSIYPDGYHCNPEEPLPFLAISSKKNHIAVHHMGIYADESLLNWFTTEYPKHCVRKLDIGKSCIRFKKPEQIPYTLIAELTQKMSAEQWIQLYESKLKN